MGGDSDAEENEEAAVIQMHVKQKANIVGGDSGKKKVIFTEDMSNQQVNRNKKKAFKSQQKEERKKMSKLVAAEMSSMKVDDEQLKDGEGGVTNQSTVEITSMA